ncbi:60S ribosomal protein L37A (nucleomorph) [Cryptomonas paramecium]|uniref:60S ribosomal protein L37A n=1 Tax=Cryptomonas paramaecium TaxID=2898 RepID=F2HIH7_9CRYP|nr:60S ribosomal protein L37A [Cryptomonas paramecium]AEA39101.1 60S ribosomal protein L37A [Cryptomonas paramecium]|mmetsp:Transcript_67660/g.180896  ORF Transcript_67660/g.180896 Transcript_67660/m.180896 type:complete len:93 (-) Transcript_67660:4877-5155(-)
MSKRTTKVNITGKYGVRYGSSIRKQIKNIELTQHQKYKCVFCGKEAIKRMSIGIWKCKKCNQTVAGGAWSFHTQMGLLTRGTLKRLYQAESI